jgi:hypothetical protein
MNIKAREGGGCIANREAHTKQTDASNAHRHAIAVKKCSNWPTARTHPNSSGTRHETNARYRRTMCLPPG